MPLWSDSFDRADGPLGANWSTRLGAPAIVSNQIHASGRCVIAAGAVTGPGSATATVTNTLTNSPAVVCGPAVKIASGGHNCYYGFAYTIAGGVRYAIYRHINGEQWEIAHYDHTETPGTTVTLSLNYNAGVLYLYGNGTLYVQASHNAFAANTGVGLWLGDSGGTGDDFSGSGDGMVALVVSPSRIGTLNGDTLLTIVVVGITWSSLPTISVNGGALNGAVLANASTVTAVFSPPATAGTVTLSDTTDGLTATLTIAEGTGADNGGLGGGGGGTTLSTEVVTWLDNQAAHGGLVLADTDQTEGSVDGIYMKGALGELLLGVKTTSTPGTGYAPIADLVRDLYARLWGGEEWLGASFVGPGTNAVKTDLANLIARWYVGENLEPWTVQQLADALGGDPFASHQDILTALSGISGGDNSEVLDAIAAAQGDPLATIKAVLDRVFLLDPTGAHTLAELLTATNAVRGSGSPTVRDVLTKLGSDNNSVDAKFDLVLSSIVTSTTISGLLDIAVAALAGAPGSTIDGVLDALDLLPSQIAAPQIHVPPVWPGVENVTIGESLTLSDGLTINGPMHGLVVAVSRIAPGGGGYEFGSVKSHSHVGGVIFCTDRGDYERSQSLGLQTQILVPFTMEQAESAILRLNGGFSGTVRSWLRNS